VLGGGAPQHAETSNLEYQSPEFRSLESSLADYYPKAKVVDPAARVEPATAGAAYPPVIIVESATPQHTMDFSWGIQSFTPIC